MSDLFVDIMSDSGSGEKGREAGKDSSKVKAQSAASFSSKKHNASSSSKSCPVAERSPDNTETVVPSDTVASVSAKSMDPLTVLSEVMKSGFSDLHQSLQGCLDNGTQYDDFQIGPGVEEE